MESLSPNIFVENMNETIAFYSVLGFKTVMSVPDSGDFVWVMMSCGNVNMMFQTYGSLGDEMPQISRSRGGSLLFYIKTDHVRDLFHRIEKQVVVIKGLEKTFYNSTEFSILDNNGYVLTFAEDEV